MAALSHVKRLQEYYASQKNSSEKVNLGAKSLFYDIYIPKLMLKLIEEKKWYTKDLSVLKTMIPWNHDDLKVVGIDKAWWATAALADAFDSSSEYFGSQVPNELPLPWLDWEQAVVIAEVNEYGNEKYIALDFRASRNDPRVVANKYINGGTQWLQVSAKFSDFVSEAQSLGEFVKPLVVRPGLISRSTM